MISIPNKNTMVMKLQSRRIVSHILLIIVVAKQYHAAAQQQQQQSTRLRQRTFTNQGQDHSLVLERTSHLRDTNSKQQIQQIQNQRWLVQYENTDGEAVIFKHATQLHHWFAKEQMVAVTLEENSLVLLRNSPGIVSMEKDNLWVEQGYFERFVEPSELLLLRKNQRRFLASETNHPDEMVPYGISMVQADQVEMGDTPVTVCIVDTGIDLGHPDLDASLVTGADRETEDADGVPLWLRWNTDARGHGTHVAGTIMARANNGIGVRGMGEIPIFVTRGLDDTGNAFESDIREAIEQCEAAGAKIVSLSLGGDEMSNAMQTLIRRLYNERNMLIFAAAGNAGAWKTEYPASDPSVVSVSAVDETEWYWDRANYGPALELMAPGVKILSTTVNSSGEYSYAEYSGTSMAVPHASAAAALVWSHHPECTNHQIRFALAASAKDKGEPGCDTDFGYGIVQVKSALDFLNANSCVDATWGSATMTGNCTILDLPTNETVDDNNEKVSSVSPSVAPVESTRTEPPVSYDYPVDEPDMDIPDETQPPSTISPSEPDVPDETRSPSTVLPSESATDATKETEAPTTDPTNVGTEFPATESPKERTDGTEAPATDVPEPPNLDEPAPFEIPETTIPESSTGPLEPPEVDIPSKNAGPLDLPVTSQIPPSNHPFEPELPGVIVFDVPPVYAPSEEVTDSDTEDDVDQRDESWSSQPTIPPTNSPTAALLSTPVPSMFPTSQLVAEGIDDETEDTAEGSDEIEGEVPGQPSKKPEAIFSAFLSPFDGTGPTSPLVPVARPKREFFQGNQASSVTKSQSRRRKRPSRGIWS